MSILYALTHGYGAHKIVSQLAKKYPKHANAIHNAQALGYSADTILRHGLNKNDPDYEETDQILTEHAKARRSHEANKREAAIQAIGLLGTAGAVTAGGYQLYNMNRAIRPNAILPPLPSQNSRGNSGLIGVPNAQGGASRPLQIGQPGQSPPQNRMPPQMGGPSPQSPSPQGPRPQGGSPQPNNQPPANPQEILQQNPIVERNYNLVRNIDETSRFENMVAQGYDVATTAALLKSVLPKSKVALLDKTEGGLEGVVANFMLYNQANPPAIREQFQPKPINTPPRPQQQQGEQSQAEPQMTPVQAEQMQGQADQMQGQEVPFIPEEQMQQQAGQAQQQQQSMMQPGQAQRPNMTENMQRIAGKIGQPQQEQESPQIKRDRFAIANKRGKDEKPGDFTKRKLLNDTLKTAAKMVASGKDFSDLPYQPSVTYSTAKDVLKFLAGAPTTFDELLDEEEKEELHDASNPQGIESSLQGAHMTPNLVWNLILSINPKVTDLVPPSIKGSKGKPAGGKMGTTEARRFLTHAVAGILGGKTVSFELADKIGKISQATDALDVIANAAAHGDVRKIEDQLMKLDPAIFEVLESQLNDSVPDSLAWMRKKAGIEDEFSRSNNKTNKRKVQGSDRQGTGFD